MLTNRSYHVGLEIIFYIGFLIPFVVKSPIIPFNTWLSGTHGEAHYNTCMILAGFLLKMGAHGLLRINMELLTRAHSIFFINGNSSLQLKGNIFSIFVIPLKQLSDRLLFPQFLATENQLISINRIC
ncbi:hypothetical protein Lal_00030079 [Lupinus albus]|nr:hypothetical protein Lal_00030079 [Lupinus albus]